MTFDAAATRFAADLAATLGNIPDADRPIALAVSGGPDSMAMLALANAAFPGRIAAATVDHRLRLNAADEAAMVARWCADAGVPHTTLTASVPPRGASMQAQARRLRYALLGEWACDSHAAALLTAHHADDQAETFLMRAARGSGAAGLAGIRPCWIWERARWHRGHPRGGIAAVADADHVTVARPLLNWRRAELAMIAASLPHVDDPSNADPAHDRTRFRTLLADGAIDPAALARAADHCREADVALSATVAWLWRERSSIGDDDERRIDVRDLPRELRRRLARMAIGHVRLVNGLTEGRWSDGTNIEALLDSLDHDRTATLAGVVARAEGTVWHFRKAPPRRST